MNLEESDVFAEKQKQTDRKKRVVLVSIGLCAILIVLLVILIVYIRYLDTLELKMFIDGEQKEISGNLFIEDQNVKYVNLRQMTSMLGYNYTKGEYKKYNEDEKSCYINNDFEIVAITADTKSFVKYIDVKEGSEITTAAGPFGTDISVKSENGEFNTFTMDNAIKFVEGQIYVPFDSLTDIYNISVDTSENNRIRISTLPALFREASGLCSNLGYASISGVYENIKAIPYGLVVVGDGTSFGVIDLSKRGEEILSIKYENLEFIQNTQEFFMSADSTVGLLDKTGKTIIKPMEYDEISVLDELKQLYLVKKDSKYGVLNRNGDIVVHVDYDRIGIKNIEEFGNNVEQVRNKDLLFDECIVVSLDSKYGMFDINGKELLKPNYETLGYKTASTDISGENSVLVIPEETGIKGIVVCYNGFYGIFDANVKKLIIPCACTRIYSTTMAGTTTYYMEFNGEQMELNNYLVTYDLKSVGKSNSNTNDINITEDNDSEQENFSETVETVDTTESSEQTVDNVQTVEENI